MAKGDGKVVIETKVDDTGAKKGLEEVKEKVKKTSEESANESKKSNEKIRKESQKTKEKTKKDQEETSETSKKESEKTEHHWTGAFKRIGVKVLKATGVALTGSAVAIGKWGSDFEAQMSRVGAISGATEKEFEMLTEKAKEMGIKTKFSATESGQAMEYMAMAGWKTEDMLNGVEGIMNLAAASGEDLAATSDIVTDALTAFGLSAKDSTHFADVLAMASSNANTNVGMMGETFKYVAPVAGALGYSVEDISTAIGLMANSGIKGSQAGTALRGILTRLVKPTDEVAAAMDEFNISVTDADGNIKPFSQLMLDLRDRFSSLTESEKAQLAATLAGQEGMSGLLAIVNSSDADFEKLQNAINNADGAALNMSSTMNDNLQGAFTILKSSLEGMGIAVYEKIKEPLKNAVQFITEGINELTTAFNSGGLSAVLSVIGDLGIQIVQKIIGSFPLVLQAGGQLLTNLVTGFVQAIPTALPKVLDFIQGIGDSIAAAAPTLIQKGFELLSMLVQGITTAIPILIEKVPTIISTFANVINDNFPTILMKGVQLIGQLIMGIIQAIPTLIANVPKIIKAIVDVWSAFNWLSLGSKAITFLKDGVLSMVGAVKNAGSTIFNAIKNAIFNLPNTLMNIGKSAIHGLGVAISGLVGFIKMSALKIVSGIETTFLRLPGKMLEIGKNLIRGLWNGISDMGGWIAKKIQGFGAGVVDSLKDFFGIHSPARKFMPDIGKYMAQGLVINGWEKYDPIKQIRNSLDVGMRGLSLFGQGQTTNATTMNNTYNISGVQTPDDVTRQMNLYNQYGLAGAY